MKRLFTGTSGFAYKEWKGSFYPEDLPAAKMLEFYGQHFGAVEINNTFYRMPDAKVLRGWAEQVPSDFRFVLKASRQITHMTRLKEPQPLEYLVQQSELLRDRRGPLLFQLPPNMKKDLERLKQFLGWLPGDVRAAFEFRNAGWFDDDVFAALRERNVALCIAHTEEEEGAVQTPFVATADWSYLRLRKVSYRPGELTQWAARIREPAWGDVFVFFKHEDEGTGPKLAKQFEALFPP
ncbi:MAG TPA: DUF72 domain-containing protein [Myxococcota bacterium]|nr:DUF72 domain-containing protein [Myxococcota bacterium]